MITADRTPSFVLGEGYVIYVQKKGIAEVGYFLRQLLPELSFMTVGLSVSPPSLQKGLVRDSQNPMKRFDTCEDYARGRNRDHFFGHGEVLFCSPTWSQAAFRAIRREP